MLMETNTDVTMVPPHDADAEAALIGSMMLDAAKIDAVHVDPAWFYVPGNQVICRTLMTMHSAGVATDPVTVASQLDGSGQLSSAGGIQHLYHVTEIVPHSEHCQHYADIVRDKFLRRSAINRVRWAISELSRDDCDVQHVIHQTTTALSESTTSTADQFGGQCVSEVWQLAEQPVEWLVQDVLSADQPTIFGAKQKSLKTTLLTDLAVSLASGWQWLGKYDIPCQKRVLFITGEASTRAAMRKVKHAATMRNVTVDHLTGWLRIEAMDFPNLPNPQHCHAISRTIQQHGSEVVVLDPLYMGLQGLNTSNLTEVGPAMRQFMHCCQPASTIIAHHVKKSASYDDAPNLEDLSQAGIAEFAGNYWLMGRMGEYQGDGRHTLAIRYGGRDEQFGLLRLQFDERHWTSEVSSLLDHREELARQQDTERFNRWFEMATKFLQRKQSSGETASVSSVAEHIGTKPARQGFIEVIDELVSRGVAEIYSAKPTKNSKECECIKLTAGQVQK